jgi:hypothetical protein
LGYDGHCGGKSLGDSDHRGIRAEACHGIKRVGVCSENEVAAGLRPRCSGKHGSYVKITWLLCFFAIFTSILNFWVLFEKNYPLDCVLSHENRLGGIKMPEEGVRRLYRNRDDYQADLQFLIENFPGGISFKNHSYTIVVITPHIMR